MHRAPGSTWLVLLGGAAALLAATACQKDATPAGGTPKGPGAGTTPAAASQQTPTSTSPAGSIAQPSAAALTLMDPTPADGAVVDTPAITIRGQVTVGTDVSINGDLATVGDNGVFSHNVSLEPGPNVIEIIATTEDGGEAFQQLTIYYVPAP